MAVTDSPSAPVGVCQNIINRLNGVADNPVPVIANTPATPASIGMTANSTCETAEELAVLLTPLLMEKFRFKTDTEAELLRQTQSFLEKTGVTNDSLYAYMATQAWPMVKTVEEPLSLITHPVTALLSEIAGYVGLALDEQYHLEQGVTYKSLSSWAKATLHLSINDASSTAVSTSVGDPRVPNKTSKVPSFALKPFTGDEFDGDDYIHKVENTFENYAMSRFLKKHSYCESNPEWSGAFCARIRASIRDNHMIGFIAEEQAEQSNSCDLWKVIRAFLTSAELRTVKTTKHWDKLFNLQCEDMETFMSFYSSFKTQVSHLTKLESIAITDDTFVRSFLARVINVDELKEETKQFLKCGTKKYEEILQDILGDFRAQESASSIQNKAAGKSSLSSRRVDVKTGKRSNAFPKLPANSCRAMDPHHYNQLKEWYKLVSKPDRTDTEFQKAQNFKFTYAPAANKAKGKANEPRPGYQGNHYDPNHHKNKQRPVKKYNGNQKYDRSSRRGRRDSPSSSRSASNGRYRSRNRSRSPSPRNKRAKSRDRSNSPARRKSRRAKRSSSRSSSASPARNRKDSRSTEDRRIMFGNRGSK